jgi:hypothetical protein
MLRRTLLCAGAALVSAAAIGAAQGAAAQAPESFAVAIVGDDGLLVPVARFDGAAWEKIWAEPNAAVPASLEAVPTSWFPPDGRAPSQWHLWLVRDPQAAATPFEARTARVLTVERLAGAAARCQTQVALQTDYRGAGVASTEGSKRASTAGAKQTRTKAGVALSVASLRLEQAMSLAPDSPLASVAADRAALAFHRAEEDQIEILEPEVRKTLPPLAVRRTTKVVWTSIVRLGVAQAPAKIWYLEGETQYGAVVMTGHVWLQVDRDRETPDAEVVITDRDRREVRARLPLGVLRVGDRRFWIFETRHWESESYEIVEVSGQGQRPITLLEVAGVGC